MAIHLRNYDNVCFPSCVYYLFTFNYHHMKNAKFCHVTVVAFPQKMLKALFNKQRPELYLMLPYYLNKTSGCI